MLKKLLALPAALLLGVAAAPAANAQIVECQLTGVLIVVAINGPVTVCSVDTNTTDPVSVQLGPLNLSPHLFAPAPDDGP